MHKVAKVCVEKDYCLYVEFEDGTRGTVDLSDRLFGPIFEPLKDPAFFRRVTVDDFGAICWPNGADLAPDALYRSLAEEEPKVSADVSRSRERGSGAKGVERDLSVRVDTAVEHWTDHIPVGGDQ